MKLRQFPPMLAVALLFAFTGSEVMAQRGRFAHPANREFKIKERPVGYDAGPCLQDLTPTSVTIIWATERPSLGCVEYTVSSSGLSSGTKRTFDDDSKQQDHERFHKVTLKELNPGSTYKYRIYSGIHPATKPSDADWSPMPLNGTFSFHTPEKAPFRVTALVVNDLNSNFDILPDLLKRGKTTSPLNAVIFNGDMMDGIHNNNLLFEKFLNPVSKAFAAESPFYFVRGNEDTPVTFTSDLIRYLGLPGNHYYYAFDIGPIRAIVLDSGRNNHAVGKWAARADKEEVNPENYRREQQQWLETEVQGPAFLKAKYRVVFVHMPLFTQSLAEGDGIVACREKWAPILAKAGIDLMFSGHLHRFSAMPATTDHPYPILIGDSAADSQSGPKDTATVIRLEANQQSLTATVIRIDGKVLHTASVQPRKTN